jgi:hypothetical protein
VASRASEGFMDWLFDLVAPEDIVYAVKNGDDLVSLFIKAIVRTFPREVEEFMEPESLFGRLRARRPELASVILSLPGGAEWFFNAAEKVRAMAQESQKQKVG